VPKKEVNRKTGIRTPAGRQRTRPKQRKERTPKKIGFVNQGRVGNTLQKDFAVEKTIVYGGNEAGRGKVPE